MQTRAAWAADVVDAPVWALRAAPTAAAALVTPETASSACFFCVFLGGVRCNRNHSLCTVHSNWSHRFRLHRHICSASNTLSEIALGGATTTPPAGHREKSQLPTVLLLGSAKNEYARCMRASTRRFCSLLSHGQTNSCRSV